jgi:hypothetical protein
LKKDEQRMKVHGYLTIVFGLILCSCNQSPQSTTVTENKIETPTGMVKTSMNEKPEDKTEILNLIRSTKMGRLKKFN